MNDAEINSVVKQIEAMPPETKGIVLQFLRLLSEMNNRIDAGKLTEQKAMEILNRMEE